MNNKQSDWEKMGPTGQFILVGTLIVVGFATLLSMLAGSSGSNYSYPTTIMTPDEKLGHTYSSIRMQQEGLSAEDANIAADAIIKFNRAQQKQK